MARKKIVFVIVEGPSDDNAIGYFLDKLFDKNTVHVHVMHCDITTEKGVNYNNIHLKCCEIVKAFAKNNHYNKENFERLIHLVDTDGAFADSSVIIEDTEIEHTYYSTEVIKCKSKEKIEKRNKQKAENINRLTTCASIWSSIPYNVYYMSCNLDHVLYDKQNSTDEEKEDNSYDFLKKYKSSIDGFKNYICNSSFSANGNYKETWEFIRKNNNSLKRYTNLGLCFLTTTKAPK